LGFPSGPENRLSYYWVTSFRTDEDYPLMSMTNRSPLLSGFVPMTLCIVFLCAPGLNGRSNLAWADPSATPIPLPEVKLSATPAPGLPTYVPANGQPPVAPTGTNNGSDRATTTILTPPSSGFPTIPIIPSEAALGPNSAPAPEAVPINRAAFAGRIFVPFGMSRVGSSYGQSASGGMGSGTAGGYSTSGLSNGGASAAQGRAGNMPGTVPSGLASVGLAQGEGAEAATSSYAYRSGGNNSSQSGSNSLSSNFPAGWTSAQIRAAVAVMRAQGTLPSNAGLGTGFGASGVQVPSPEVIQNGLPALGGPNSAEAGASNASAPLDNTRTLSGSAFNAAWGSGASKGGTAGTAPATTPSSGLPVWMASYGITRTGLSATGMTQPGAAGTGNGQSFAAGATGSPGIGQSPVNTTQNLNNLGSLVSQGQVQMGNLNPGEYASARRAARLTALGAMGPMAQTMGGSGITGLGIPSLPSLGRMNSAEAFNGLGMTGGMGMNNGLGMTGGLGMNNGLGMTGGLGMNSSLGMAGSLGTNGTMGMNSGYRSAAALGMSPGIPGGLGMGGQFGQASGIGNPLGGTGFGGQSGMEGSGMMGTGMGSLGNRAFGQLQGLSGLNGRVSSLFSAVHRRVGGSVDLDAVKVRRFELANGLTGHQMERLLRSPATRDSMREMLGLHTHGTNLQALAKPGS